ncbi:hypothetical protein MY04_1271 [Flammeovirga sp. MY04]|nr:hypothetical protein [Flammeovirga sp. MY04]ANQ48648.2 hypothetical protein MY04_1271 [Flammeovirga sp. MY04]
MKNLKEKTAIITGGGTGVGKAIATTLVSSRPFPSIISQIPDLILRHH